MAHTGPIHGIVDATPSWVARRLEALSATLLLPCPVRSAFLFPANQAFYTLCTTSVITLQQAARRVVEHLGLDCDTVVVTYRSDLPNPARIEREGGHWFIEISDKHRSDGPVLGAILAHECCHILLEERGVPHFDTAVDEVHVDLALMLAGLGALTLNAIEDRTITTANQITTIHRSFGYLRAKLLRYAYAHVALALRIERKRALLPLTQAPSRDDVSAYFLTSLRARRSKLAYRPLAPHVILPCLSAACSKRLRVPTGTPGKARCPACGESRAFDGRPLSIQPRAEPAPMKAAPLPQDRAIDRAGRFVYNLSDDVRLVIAVVLFLVAVPTGIWLYGELRKQALGGPCGDNTDCHSGMCLHPAQPSRFDNMGYPSRARGLEFSSAVCTSPCKTDADCPGTFACMNAVSRDSTSIWATNVEVRVCVRR